MLLPDDDRGDYSPTLTPGQRMLWEWYTDALSRVLSLAGRSQVHVIHNGDVCQGTRYGDGLMSNRIADHLRIAAANMAPWMAQSQVKSLRLVTGTGAHDFGEGTAEETVAQMLGKRVSLAYHDLIDAGGGYLIDVAHHGPHTGIREWTRGNVARLYLMDRLLADDPPAHLYARAHRHDSIRVAVYRNHVMHNLIVTPSWQLPGGYVSQVAQSPSVIRCGLWALELVDGGLVDAHEYLYTMDLRRRVTL